MESCITNFVQNIPSTIQEYIYQELERAGRQCVQYFYEFLMTSMAEALSQGLIVVGFKVSGLHGYWNPLLTASFFQLLIQMVAFRYPQATECCLAKMAVLRNSYVHDEEICMKLLWGFSQAGYSDVNVGIRVWCNLLLPVIKVPRFTAYVSRYICRIIDDYSLKW